MSGLGVGIHAAVPARVDVDDGAGHHGQLVEQGVVDALGDAVGRHHPEVPVHGDAGLGVHAVAEPPYAQLSYMLDAFHPSRHRLGLGHQLGAHGVHEALTNAPCRLDQHHDDHCGDTQTDGGVGPFEARGQANRPQQHCQGGEAVAAGMQALGYEGGRTDPASDPHPVDGHRFVANQSDQGGGGHSSDVAHVLGVP